MLKKLIFLFILIFLVACASERTEDAGGEQTNDTTDETEALTLSSEISLAMIMKMLKTTI